MRKIWRGRPEKIIETKVNLARKELIRKKLNENSIAFEEQESDRRVEFIAKNFTIEYDFSNEKCHLSAYQQGIFRTFPANVISEMFDFIKSKIIK